MIEEEQSTQHLTIGLLHRHHVGGGAALDDGVAHQVAALSDRPHQLRHTCTSRQEKSCYFYYTIRSTSKREKMIIFILVLLFCILYPLLSHFWLEKTKRFLNQI